MLKTNLLRAACVGLIVLPFAATADKQADAAKVHNLRFVMAHKPDNPDNIALIQDFTDRVRERTGGQVDISPIMPNQMENNAGGRQHSLAYEQLYSGQVEMGQISAKYYFSTAPDLRVVDMPGLFKDHDHVTRVLDGQVGSDLLASVYSGSNQNIKGLAFTYSGGFRNLYTTKPVASLEDLKGKTTRFAGNSLSRDMNDFLGLKSQSISIGSKNWVKAHEKKTVEVEEAEVIRLAMYERNYPEVIESIDTVFETHHNLYLTLVSINGKVFDSLTPEQQAIVQEEASKLAVQERELSIQQAEDGKKLLSEKYGIKFVALSEDEKKLMFNVSEQISQKYAGQLGRWVTAISDLASDPRYAAVHTAH